MFNSGAADQRLPVGPVHGRRACSLVDFKVEFGRLYTAEDVRVVLADEISPDSCRLWDTDTGESMDKDRFRKDMGGLREAYQEVARRLGILQEMGPAADYIPQRRLDEVGKAESPGKSRRRASRRGKSV